MHERQLTVITLRSPLTGRALGFAARLVPILALLVDSACSTGGTTVARSSPTGGDRHDAPAATARPATTDEAFLYEDVDIPDPAPFVRSFRQPSPEGSEDRLPKGKELLARPIKLSGCPVTITEWRPSRGKANTGPTWKGIKLLTKVCKDALKAYPEFLEHEGLADLRTDHSELKKQRAALMPWDSHGDGADPRNLNDLALRFRSRTQYLDVMGQVEHLEGYMDPHHDYIYMRNDVLLPDGSPNAEAANTFAHELFHAMNRQSGVFINLLATETVRLMLDEEMAEKFTRFMGLG